jgi:acyl transferase domain-containing protein
MAESVGVYLSTRREPAGKVAFLFPGQGSQYPGMHRDLSVYFPDLRHALEVADRVTSGQYSRRLSSFVCPPPAFSDDQSAQQLRELTDTFVAQPALGAVETGLCDLLRRLGVRPDMTAGHSYGEYVALSVGGAFPADVLYAISAARGRAIKAAAGDHPGTMASVSASPDAITQVLTPLADVWIANLNSPRQTVLAGSVEAIDAAVAALSAAGLAARRIPVSCAFHSPLVEPAARVMADLLARTDVHEPSIPVFSNTLAAPYPTAPAEIRRVLSEHITASVRFAEQLDAMYREGARIFIEVGPRAVLSNLVRETLSAHSPLILPLDSPERHGVTHLLHVVAQLAVAGVPIDFEELWRGRAIESIQLARLAPPEPLPRHVWMVSGGRARRQDETVSHTPRQAAASIDAVATPTLKPAAASSRSTPRNINEIAIPEGGPMPPDSPVRSAQFVVDPASEDVMRQFQQLMSQFLQTQAMVMTAYLQGTPAAGASTLAAVAQTAPRALTPRPAPQPGGVPPKPASQPASAVAAASAPVAAQPSVSLRQVGTSASDVLSQVLDIVSERTGYPQDMLDADANIEADLGIDSIKRMEILTAFQQMHAAAGAQRGGFQGAMERLTSMKTLRETASVLTELLAEQDEAAVA